jgi:hypothetical protein
MLQVERSQSQHGGVGRKRWEHNDSEAIAMLWVLKTGRTVEFYILLRNKQAGFWPFLLFS